MSNISKKVVVNGRLYDYPGAEPLEEILEKMGATDITEIADGTVTGAIAEHDDQITQINNDLSELSDYTQIGATGVYYRKYLNMVELHISKNNVTITNTGVLIATLPEGFWPTYTIRFSLPLATDPSTPPAFGVINPNNGEIKFSAWSTISNITIYAHHMYLVE